MLNNNKYSNNSRVEENSEFMEQRLEEIEADA